MKNESQLIWETLQRVDEADYVPPHDEDKLDRARERGYEDGDSPPHHDAVDHDNQEPVSRVGDVASGDPREYKIGQILKASQTGDHLDGMIVDISEEDGELEFALMEVGEEGWTVRASEIKPDGEPGGEPRPSLATGWK
jgi:hypothetical protein